MNEEKCVRLLNDGIAQKRLGKYALALDYYEQARALNPNNWNVFYNPAKLLLGLGRYDEALKYFLTYSHVLIIRNSYFSPMEELARLEIVDGLTKVKHSITTNFQLPDYWLEKILSDSRFNKPVVDINCNRYVGFCLTANSNEFNQQYQITEAHSLFLKNGLLGKGSSGIELSGNQEYVLAAIGLIFTWKNLDFAVSNIDQLNVRYFQSPILFLPKID